MAFKRLRVRSPSAPLNSKPARTASPGGFFLCAACMRALRQQLLNHLTLHVRQAEVSPLEPEREFAMVQPQQVKDRRLHVMHVDAILDRAEAQFIRCADADA